MSDFLLKLQAQEVALPTTANTVANATVVRLLNTGGASHLITLTDNAGTGTIGSITIAAGQDLYITKETSQKLKVDSGTDVKAVPIGYR